MAGVYEHSSVTVVCFTGDSGLTDYSASFCRQAVMTHDVVLATSSSIEPLYRELGFPVDEVFRRSRHYPIDVARFVRRMLAERPRLLLFQSVLKFAFVDALLVRLLRARGLRTAVVVHDVAPHSGGKLRRAGYRLYYRSFPQLIAHSRDAERELRAMGVTGQILVVPHGRYDIFDLDGITRDEARTLLGVDKERKLALFFGNLEERKGLTEFVEAAERNADPAVLFLAAGQDFLTSQAPRGVRDAVRGARAVSALRVDVGRVPHRKVQRYFRAADVVVLPYREGSTSGVLKLALAFGVPVLATDVGDIGEQLIGTRGRLLATPPTAEGILRGIGLVASEDAGAPSGTNDELAWNSITPRVLSFLLG